MNGDAPSLLAQLYVTEHIFLAIRFVAGATRTPAKAAPFAAQHGLRLAPSYQALLADEEVDAVVLATPHSQHAQQTIDAAGAVNRWKLPVIMSFRKVLSALLAGDTVVLRPSPFTPLTVLRISDYIREMLSPGVFNVVTGGHDLWPWKTAHSETDLITFTRATTIGKHVSKSAAETLKPVMRERGGHGPRMVPDGDPEKAALFGSIALFPVNWNLGRYGLASTLFELLSFQPVLIRTQVLVWRLARKASYDFFRAVGEPA